MTDLPRFRSTDESRDREFYATLKRRVDAYFVASGISQHGDWRMATKAVFWIGSSVAAWLVLVAARPAAPVSFLVWGWLGASLIAVGFNVSHDAMHGATSASAAVNRALSWTWEGLGCNMRNWYIAHNVLHHTYTNVPGVDTDIEPGPKLRFHAHSPWRPHYRFQHLLAWPMYAMLTLNWVTVGDLKLAFQRDPKSGRGPSGWDTVRFGIGKGFHFFALLLIPLLVLDQPIWQVLVGFVVMHAVAGLMAATTFQLAHVVEGPEFVPPNATGELDSTWAVHQLRTTANFQPRSRFLGFLLGGLNHQVEHHLFPRICHVHYPAIAPLVEQTAREFGLPYHSWPTMRAALAAHYRAMRTLAAPNPA